MGNGRAKVQVLFEAGGLGPRPIAASRKLALAGRRVTVEVPKEALSAPTLFLLVRSGSGDVVLAASSRSEPVEEARCRLGNAASAYNVVGVPVVAAMQGGSDAHQATLRVPGRETEQPVRALTAREIDVLAQIAKGLSHAETAKVLTISQSTVHSHLENIYKKLKVSSRVEAIAVGRRTGLIETPRAERYSLG
jgi:DNA-binding NarL/FixJ family response regulator